MPPSLESWKAKRKTRANRRRPNTYLSLHPSSRDHQSLVISPNVQVSRREYYLSCRNSLSICGNFRSRDHLLRKLNLKKWFLGFWLKSWGSPCDSFCSFGVLAILFIPATTLQAKECIPFHIFTKSHREHSGLTFGCTDRSIHLLCDIVCNNCSLAL